MLLYKRHLTVIKHEMGQGRCATKVLQSAIKTPGWQHSLYGRSELTMETTV